MKLRSCLYECKVMHHRLQPKEHRFDYQLFYLALDLDEIDQVAKQVHGFSRNRWNLYEFRDRDHLTLPEISGGTVKQHLLAWIAQQGLALPPETRITLVTLPRVLGYIFNPVSFYFCEDATGSTQCVVVQVGNTFREMKPYFIREPERPGFFHLVTPKHFYVSPFSELDLAFDFKVKVPDEQLEIHIDVARACSPHAEPPSNTTTLPEPITPPSLRTASPRHNDALVLLSALTGKRQELTTARLAWLTLKFPIVTLKVIFLIHWQALRLWWKGLAFHRKADNRELQRDVFNKHP